MTAALLPIRLLRIIVKPEVKDLIFYRDTYNLTDRPVSKWREAIKSYFSSRSLLQLFVVCVNKLLSE